MISTTNTHFSFFTGLAVEISNTVYEKSKIKMFPKKENNSVIFYFFFLAFSCFLMYFVNSFDLFSNIYIYNQWQRVLSVHVKKKLER